MEGVVKLLLILQNQHSRNTTIVSYVVKLKVPQKIHLRRPDLRFYMEFSRLGSSKAEVLEIQQHTHHWRSTADKS